MAKSSTPSAAASAPAKRSRAAKKKQLRNIAALPYRGTVSVKVLDAAIKAVMAKRDAATAKSVRVKLPAAQASARGSK